MDRIHCRMTCRRCMAVAAVLRRAAASISATSGRCTAAAVAASADCGSCCPGRGQVRGPGLRDRWQIYCKQDTRCLRNKVNEFNAINRQRQQYNNINASF